MMWSQTKLWSALNDSTTTQSSTVSVLETILPDISRVLRSGSTSPLDFTLHDDEHAFRVAERVAGLLAPSIVSVLGHFEIALILLACYLHDIGMSPHRRRFDAVWRLLAYGEKTPDSLNEQRPLQSWLDAEWHGLQPPLLGGRATKSERDTAEHLFSYYARSRHNDWSEEWIRENLAGKLDLYAGSLDDLIVLCRSHHEGLAELRRTRFDPRIVSSPPQVVNLRFLAALLRVADVLEFDPERTPDVILRHRFISPSSQIYWYKDHLISFHAEPDGSKLVFTARTPSASIHKAVMDTANSVNEELACCATLEHEGAFLAGVIPPGSRNRYAWRWPSRLALDIREKDDSFVYIDGAFRPNTKKILDLLSGTSLYGTPLAAIRELLQNAIDAVKEQLAYERLLLEDANNPKMCAALAATKRIRIYLEELDNRIWIVCSDNGVGMSKDIIERYLLVSGSSARSDLRFLEREAAARNFSVGRTGQFGIGILSYFMLADKMEVSSRRSGEAGDTDGTGWQFVTHGIDDFGELSKFNRSSRGTEVRLRIKKEIEWDIEEAFSKISIYVRSTLTFAPCSVSIELRSSYLKKSIDLGPGWTRDWEQIEEAMLSGMRVQTGGRGRELPTLKKQEEHKKQELLWNKLKSDALRSVKSFGPFEYLDDDTSAQARIWVPYFEIDREISLLYFKIEGGNVVRMPNRNYATAGSFIVYTSYKGFATENRMYSIKSCIVEIDILDHALIDVSRKHLNIQAPDKVWNFVRRIAAESIDKCKTQLLGSKYRYMSAAYMGWRISASKPVSWLVVSQSDCRLADIHDGFIESHDRYASAFSGEIEEPSSKIRLLPIEISDYYSQIIPSAVLGGGKASMAEHAQSIDIEWTHSLQSSGFELCEFAGALTKFSVVSTPYRTILNRDCLLAKWVDFDLSLPSSVEEQIEFAKKGVRECATLIANTIASNKDYWQSLHDNYRPKFDELLSILSRCDIKEISGLSTSEPFEAYSVTISTAGVKFEAYED